MSHAHANERLHLAQSGSAPALIELDDFCFAYDSSPALRHVSLRIGAGDSVVLMGDNGSGKSTLLKAICGLIYPQQGSYRFDGSEVSERSMHDATFAKRLHQRVGFIFQDSDAQLFCASVADEIAFGPRQMGLDEREVARRVSDTLALLDIERLRDRAPYALSGGEKKRVAIACVLSMNPDVYCFDGWAFWDSCAPPGRPSWLPRTTSRLPTRLPTTSCTWASSTATRTVPTCTSTPDTPPAHGFGLRAIRTPTPAC